MFIGPGTNLVPIRRGRYPSGGASASPENEKIRRKNMSTLGGPILHRPHSTLLEINAALRGGCGIRPPAAGHNKRNYRQSTRFSTSRGAAAPPCAQKEIHRHYDPMETTLGRRFPVAPLTRNDPRSAAWSAGHSPAAWNDVPEHQQVSPRSTSALMTYGSRRPGSRRSGSRRKSAR